MPTLVHNDKPVYQSEKGCKVQIYTHTYTRTRTHYTAPSPDPPPGIALFRFWSEQHPMQQVKILFHHHHYGHHHLSFTTHSTLLVSLTTLHSNYHIQHHYHPLIVITHSSHHSFIISLLQTLPLPPSCWSSPHLVTAVNHVGWWSALDLCFIMFIQTLLDLPQGNNESFCTYIWK